MKTLTISLSILVMSFCAFGQGTSQGKEQSFLIGVFSSEKETTQVRPQIALNHPISEYTTVHMYVTVKGKQFRILRYSKSEIEEFEKITFPQVQKPDFVSKKDYYIRDNNADNNNGKYCLVSGIIDQEKQIIYKATLVEVYDEDKIIEALKNYTTLAAEGEDTMPQHFPISLFGVGATNIVPQESRLTKLEEASFFEFVKTTKIFPRYVYSGCHDRAHAAYKLLPRTLKPKVMKIWLMSPGVYSAGFYGLIGIKSTDEESKNVSWGYHVALAYRDSSGSLRVLDPVLRPDGVITEREWFGLLKIPALSLWTLTQPTVYQFNFTATNSDSVNKQVWTGKYFNDNNGGLKPDTLPSVLARDAIGVDALGKVTCATLQSQARNPDQLQNLLNGTLPADCKASAERYTAEKARWTDLLLKVN